MAEQIEVPSIENLPNENGMFTESYVLIPKTNFDMEMMIEVLTALNITFDHKAFEPLSEALKKQFVILGRDGKRDRYGMVSRSRR